jgi:hypothetical protein
MVYSINLYMSLFGRNRQPKNAFEANRKAFTTQLAADQIAGILRDARDRLEPDVAGGDVRAERATAYVDALSQRLGERGLSADVATGLAPATIRELGEGVDLELYTPNVVELDPMWHEIGKQTAQRVIVEAFFNPSSSN